MAVSVSLASLYLTKLLIIGCVGGDDSEESTDPGYCPESVAAETWVGLGSKQECEVFTRQKEFNPEKYLPGWDGYIVRCEG